MRLRNGHTITELVYTIDDVVALTGLSRITVTRMFEHETGVIVTNCAERMHKSGYRSIRIPLSVYERIITRMTVT